MKRLYAPTRVALALGIAALMLLGSFAPIITGEAHANPRTASPGSAGAGFQLPNPRTAWYYVQGEDGTGVAIEIRDGVLFLAWFTFDESGQPNWFSAGGTMTDANTFSGPLSRWSGWELGTEYIPPTPEPAGTVSVTFTSSTTVTMDWTLGELNGQLLLTNFLDVFAPGDPDPRNIIGWWSFPGFDGMGVFIGAQGGSLFMAWFQYGPDGAPRWWSSGSDTFPAGSPTYTDILEQYANGQSPGAPYTPPDAPVVASDIQIDFVGGSRATLTWAGGTLDMVRFPLPDFFSRILAIGSDFSTGTRSTITAPGLSVTPDIGIFDSGDNVGRQWDDFIFVLRRFGTDAIQVYRKNDLTAPIPGGDYSVNDPGGTNANPQDILVFSESKAYVTRYGLDTLLIVNPLTGEQLDTIDLSRFADADGIPEMSQMVYVDGKVFVACQRLNRNQDFAPTEFSVLAVIDPQTDGVTGSIRLTATNPGQCVYNIELGRIICAESGSFFATDGGLDVINPFTEEAEGLLLTNEALGVVSVSSFQFISPTEIFGLATIATTDTFGTQVLRINLPTQSVAATLAASDSFDFFAPLVLIQNQLFFSDRNMQNPGVRVFDATTNTEITATPLSTGSLAPSNLTPF